MLINRSKPPRRLRPRRRAGTAASNLGALLTLGVLATMASGCGTAESTASSDPTPRSAGATEGETAPSTVPRSSDVGPLDGSAPSTTQPLPVATTSCDESVVTIAERLLIERRQRDAPSSCIDRAAPIDDPGVGPPCWDRCVDGRTFSDFVLDTAAAAVEADGEAGPSVRYVARYTDATGISSTVGETLWFAPADGSDGWVLTDVTSVDLSRPRSALVALVGEFFTALEAGDFAVAAELMTRDPSGLGHPERADLGRLVDEGLLPRDGIAEGGDLAQALRRWCDSGALCRVPDDLRTEVTPQHTIRVVATHLVDGRSFDSVFTTPDGTLHGIPPRP